MEHLLIYLYLTVTSSSVTYQEWTRKSQRRAGKGLYSLRCIENKSQHLLLITLCSHPLKTGTFNSTSILDISSNGCHLLHATYGPSAVLHAPHAHSSDSQHMPTKYY